MINKKEKIYLHNKKKFDLDDKLSVSINISYNPYKIPIERLFSMAMRNNPKRRFLFVSKVLGKHLAVVPQESLMCGKILAKHYMKCIYNIDNDIEKSVYEFLDFKLNEELNEENEEFDYYLRIPEETLFIGFAETATGLGHSVFATFNNNCEFIHTTRDEIVGIKDFVEFEEEHSHAVEHRIYAEKLSLLSKKCPVTLIDDEMTTGKTNLNIIRAIHKKYPRKVYNIITILDWRNEEQINSFRLLENELDITVNTVCLLSGDFTEEGNYKDKFFIEENLHIDNKVSNNIKYLKVNNNLKKLKYTSTYKSGKKNNWSYIEYTGRFGVNISFIKSEEEKVREIGNILKSFRKCGKTLCLGTGEFIYLPMKISYYMGKDVYYHSTTKSPILSRKCKDEYAIENIYTFSGIEDKDIKNYLYNINKDMYGEVFIFFERNIDKSIYLEISKIFIMNNIENINIVVFSNEDFGGIEIYGQYF